MTRRADVREIVEQIAALTHALADAWHVGRHNRLHAKRQRLFDAIDAAPARRELLQALLGHPDPEVRLTAAWRCGWQQFMLAEAERAVVALLGLPGEVGRDAQKWLENEARMATGIARAPPSPAIAFEPMPSGVGIDQARVWIAEAFSAEGARRIAALLKPAVRAWPVPARENLWASCLGGAPSAPPRTRWPQVDGEPLIFVGQINCAEVRAAAGPTALPDEGLLQFFADYHELEGCGPAYGCAVRFVAPQKAIAARRPPDEGLPILGRCGLDFFPTFELPDFDSGVVTALGLSGEEGDVYFELRRRMALCDVTSPRMGEHASKLFGWPDLVQCDLENGSSLAEPAGQALLLQIGWYHDGTEWQSWGPGGTVYFTLAARALAARRFDLTALEVQTT